MPGWAMILSGLGIALTGLGWRLLAGDGLNKSTLKTNRVVSYGIQRTTNVMMMVGLVWASFGVFETLS